MSSNLFPSGPHLHLEFYRKQAKALLKAAQSADTDTLARIRVHLPHFMSSHPFLLSDAQWIIAREHGFASWSKFKLHVESLAASAPSPTSPAIGNAPPTQTEEKLLPEIKTAHWIRTHTHFAKQNGKIDYTFHYKEWIRLNPPAYAWREESEDSWSHDVMDERGHFHTASTWKMASGPRSFPYHTRLIIGIFCGSASEAL